MIQTRKQQRKKRKKCSSFISMYKTSNLEISYCPVAKINYPLMLKHHIELLFYIYFVSFYFIFQTSQYMAIPNPTLSLSTYVVLIAFQISLQMVIHHLLLMILFWCLHSYVLEQGNHSWCSGQQTLISLWRILHWVDKCKLRTLLSVNMSECQYFSLPLRRPARASSSSLWGILPCPYSQLFLERHLLNLQSLFLCSCLSIRT